MYCTDWKDTNIFVKIIQLDKLWYDFSVFTVSHYGEQAVSFQMVDLPKSLFNVTLILHIIGDVNIGASVNDVEVCGWAN